MYKPHLYKIDGTDSVVEIFGWESISLSEQAAYAIDIETGEQFLVREDRLHLIKD